VQIVGTGAEVAPEAGDGSILVTGSPRPLTQFGFGSRLQTDDPATTTVSEEVLLPAPDCQSRPGARTAPGTPKFAYPT